MVVDRGASEAIPQCAVDPRFAAGVANGTGYVPFTMLVVPLRRGERAIGALSILDRRDGGSYRGEDIEPAELFADLAVKALDVSPGVFTSLGVAPTVTGTPH